MCGVIGFYSQQVTAEQQALLYRLAQQSSIRGLHAFGASWIDSQGRISTSKWKTFPQVLPAAGIFIWHNRYSTSGDWHDDGNNQPIADVDIAVAVNGVISMKPRPEYEQEFGVKCVTDNDAEIFMRLLQAGNPADQVASRLSGSLAAVFIKDSQVFAVRNNCRPLHWFLRHDAVYVVSTVDIADRAAGSTIEVHNVPPFQLFRLSDYV